MTDRTRAFLRGVGSLVDIWPPPVRPEAMLPAGTADERIACYWDRTGRRLWSAMDRVDEEAARQARRTVRETGPPEHS